MRYRVLSALELEGTPTEENEFKFEELKDAMDYYRDGFTTMAETIVDYGGNFTINLIDDGDSSLLMRNIISTTVNEL